MTFIHLNLHSVYSLSEGAVRSKQIPKLCQDHNMPAVALSDTHNLFGALEFSLTCAGGCTGKIYMPTLLETAKKYYI